MSGEEAKIVLRGMVGLMNLVQLQKPDESFSAYLVKLNEAIEISCTAIDMTEDRLDIDGGGKQNE